MMPKIWGKHFWMCIHLAALAYPNNPTLEDKSNYKNFFTYIGKILPCKKCTVNYGRHTSLMPIDNHLEDRQSLFNWTVYLHNSVNKELGKPLWNTEYAYGYYKGIVNGTTKEGSYISETFKDRKKFAQIAFIVSVILNVLLIAFLVMRKK